MSDKKLIDLYPYTHSEESPLFLLFRRAGGSIYEGQWRMIGGKVKSGEMFWEAALREMKEETGLTPSKLFTLPSVNQFYEHRTDTIHTIPAFAAQISEQDQIVLNYEHNEFKWFDIDTAINMVVWPEQRRLLRLTHDIIISAKIPEEWCIPLTSD